MSRIYRLGLAVLLGLSAYSLILAGPGGFSQPDSAEEPGVWILTGFALFAVRDAAVTVFGPRWGGRALAGMVALLAGAGIAAVVAEGSLWAAPVTWLLYGLDLTFAMAIGTAMVVSIVVGTPAASSARSVRSVSWSCDSRAASTPDRSRRTPAAPASISSTGGRPTSPGVPDLSRRIGSHEVQPGPRPSRAAMTPGSAASGHAVPTPGGIT